MLILDTDVLSVLEWAGMSSEAQAFAERLSDSGEEVVSTIICLEEQIRGWMASVAKKKKVKEQIEVYRRLRRRYEILCKMRLLDFDEPAAVEFQELKKAKVRVGAMDLKIASIALANDATLVTGNLGDFRLIPGLKLDDWTKL